MFDPQDLLYTNTFTSTDILTDNNLSKENEYYDRFKNYIDNNTPSDIENYVNNDEYENSAININKTLNTKWPIYSNKNHYPLFDTYTNDISSNRYKKEIITKINIDSRNRDISLYNNSNNFSIPLNRVFNNVTKIVINDIIFRNINQSVTNTNNNLSWQYASQNFLIDNNIDNTIIPVPGSTTISYSSLQNSVYLGETQGIVNINNYLVYQSVISPGFYNITDLINKIKFNTSKVLHGQNYLKDPSFNVVEAPYDTYNKRIGTPHLFSTYIDPISSIVRFVNRMEEVKILAIQTFSPYETSFSTDDIFYYFSSQYALNQSYTLDPSYIYILLPAINDITYQYYQNINCTYTSNPFPIVLTDLDISIGNIDPDLINYTEFYDEQIYLNNGYTEEQLNSISHYKFIDTITFNNNLPLFNGTNTKYITTSSVYLRFGLKLSNGNLNGNNYDPTGYIICPSITSNIILSNSLNRLLSSMSNIAYLSIGSTASGNIADDTSLTSSITLGSTSGTTGTINTNLTNSFYTSGILGEYTYVEQNVLIGRALLYRWIFDKYNGDYVSYEYDTDNEKKRTLLHILGWTILNKTDQINMTDNNYGFRFVHTNYQSNLINNYPTIKLNLNYISNNYYFISNSYIYLKIYFDSHENLEKDYYYMNANSDNSLKYNQVYINDLYFNVGIGEDYNCVKDNNYLPIYKKDQSYIFTKILLSNIPGNYDTQVSNIINNNSYYINYDKIQDNLDSIKVEIYDYNMKLLFISNDFSFTANIHEIKDILKETLINTKNNNVNTAGNFI